MREYSTSTLASKAEYPPFESFQTSYKDRHLQPQKTQQSQSQSRDDHSYHPVNDNSHSHRQQDYHSQPQHQHQVQRRSYHEELQHQEQQQPAQNDYMTYRGNPSSSLNMFSNSGSSSTLASSRSNQPLNHHEGWPTRSQRRGASSSDFSNHPIRFNPSKNHTSEVANASSSSCINSSFGGIISTSEQEGNRSNFLPRIINLGSPCSACSRARVHCDRGTPCGTCQLNQVQCHYEGSDPSSMHSYSNSSISSSKQQQRLQNKNASDVCASNSFLPHASSDSDPASGLALSSSLKVHLKSQEPLPYNSNAENDVSLTLNTRASTQASHRPMISVPPYQGQQQGQELLEEPYHQRDYSKQSIKNNSKINLPPLSKATASSSLSSSFPSSSRPSFPEHDHSASTPKPRPVRPILPAQSYPASRLLQPSIFESDFSSKSSVMNKHSSSQQQHHQQQQQGSHDAIYSLSNASIRARKNAMEMENIQRASQFYESYIAKIKSASEGTAAFSTTATYFSQDELLSINRMDIDPIYPTSALDTNRTSSLYPNKPVQQNPLSEKGLKPIEGLDRMLRSGMLHNLVQQYFTLIHPQFMILHKNHFLFRFWAEYGPFPEAYAIHNQFNGKPSSEMNCVGGEQAGEAPIGSTPYQLAPSKSSYRNSPLLLMSMMALVARHLNDRTSMKSTIEEKHHRVMKNLTLFSHDREVVEHRCKAKLQEGRLQELMETDEHGQRDYDGEDFWDRGEQYFNWATELLKAEYEEPSLTAIQSLLLLREYAIMAGNHTQAYMYGGTAITMALGLGWDRSHLFHSSQNEEGQQPRGESKVSGSTTELREEKAGHEKQQENKARDEEQRLCWWQCFIVDRWMSVAFNRPVSIPIHVFDKSHLCPPPKIVIKSRPGDDPNVLAQKDRDTLPMGSGLPSPYFMSLPPAPYRAKLFFDQQCRQALLLDNILAFLSTWSDELFVSPAEFDKLSGTLDAWYQDLADWQKFPFSGIITPERSNNTRSSAQIYTISSSTISGSRADKANRSSNYPQRQESRDVVQSTLLGISFHTIRILLHRPFLRTNLRHPPCLPSRASLACAQSANAITSLAEHLINLPDATVQPCLLMRSQFPLVTAAGIQLMNSSLEDEPRLSTPAKINLLKTIRILRDADRSTLGGSSSAMNGHQGDGPVNSTDSETGSNELLQVLKELFPEQMKHMMSGS